MALRDTSQGPPPETPFSELSAELIRHNYRDLGCDAWNRPRFWRLCGKMQRTKTEMAALMRIQTNILDQRLKIGFTPQDGLVLTLLEREIDQIMTGKPPTKGVFLMLELKKETAA